MTQTGDPPARRTLGELSAGGWKRPLAGAALVLVLTACSTTDDSSQAPSGAPEPSAPSNASAQPSGTDAAAAEIAVDDWVTVTVEELNLRDGPTTASRSPGRLPEGMIGRVFAGPVQAEGFSWYALGSEGLPFESGCVPTSEDLTLLTCPAWPFGWVAAAAESGESWIAPLETPPQCPPAPITIDELARMAWGIAAWCYAGEALTLDGYVANKLSGRDCTVTYTATPEWLSPCDVQFLHGNDDEQLGGPELMTHMHPSVGDCAFGGRSPASCPINQFVGQWIEVDGLYDHPDAASCEVDEVRLGSEAPDPAHVVYHCRTTFVITALRPLQ